MYFSSAEKKIVLTLYECDKDLNLYDLHKRFSFSPAQLSRFVRRFQKLKVIDYTNGSIKLTDYGKDWIIENRRALFLAPTQKKWANIPSVWIANNDFKKVKFNPSVLKIK